MCVCVTIIFKEKDPEFEELEEHRRNMERGKEEGIDVNIVLTCEIF